MKIKKIYDIILRFISVKVKNELQKDLNLENVWVMEDMELFIKLCKIYS